MGRDGGAKLVSLNYEWGWSLWDHEKMFSKHCYYRLKCRSRCVMGRHARANLVSLNYEWWTSWWDHEKCFRNTSLFQQSIVLSKWSGDFLATQCTKEKTKGMTSDAIRSPLIGIGPYYWILSPCRKAALMRPSTAITWGFNLRLHGQSSSFCQQRLRIVRFQRL